MDCLGVSPSNPDKHWITRMKERATVGSKLSGLPWDPDYQASTVNYILIMCIQQLTNLYQYTDMQDENFRILSVQNCAGLAVRL
jgi:hypothetical protein